MGPWMPITPHSHVIQYLRLTRKGVAALVVSVLATLIGSLVFRPAAGLPLLPHDKRSLVEAPIPRASTLHLVRRDSTSGLVFYLEICRNPTEKDLQLARKTLQRIWENERELVDDETRAWLLTLLGQVNLDLGRVAEAVERLTEAHSADPENPWATERLIWALKAEQDRLFEQPMPWPDEVQQRLKELEGTIDPLEREFSKQLRLAALAAEEDNRGGGREPWAMPLNGASYASLDGETQCALATEHSSLQEKLRDTACTEQAEPLTIQASLDRMPVTFTDDVTSTGLSFAFNGVPSSLFQDRVLMLRDPAEVSGRMLTCDRCGDCNPTCTWTFGHLMAQMANRQANGSDPSAFVDPRLRERAAGPQITNVDPGLQRAALRDDAWSPGELHLYGHGLSWTGLPAGPRLGNQRATDTHMTNNNTQCIAVDHRATDLACIDAGCGGSRSTCSGPAPLAESERPLPAARNVINAAGCRNTQVAESGLAPVIEASNGLDPAAAIFCAPTRTASLVAHLAREIITSVPGDVLTLYRPGASRQAGPAWNGGALGRAGAAPDGGVPTTSLAFDELRALLSLYAGRVIVVESCEDELDGGNHKLVAVNATDLTDNVGREVRLRSR